MNTFDVAAVMERIRAEVQRRGPRALPGTLRLNDEVPALDAASDAAAPDLEQKPSYVLADFLGYSDETLVRNVFQAVLRRSPDPEGAAFYVDALRNGRFDKVDVLASVRWSPEGIRRGVHIDGLLVPTVLRRWKRKRFIGPIIAWLHALARLGRVTPQVASVEAGLARQVTSLTHRVAAMDAVTAEQYDAVRLLVEDANARAAKIEMHAAASWETLHAQVDDVRSCMADLLGSVAEAQRSWEGGVEELKVLQMQVLRYDELRESLATLEARLSKLAEERAKVREVDEERRRFERSLDPFYVAFEQQFRGSPELLRERMLPYVDILRDANVGDTAHPVIDIGCGNGDWLDLLRQLGFVGRGVDSNATFVELCRGRGLEVVERDVLDYLSELDDGSVGAVTGIHIAEHLPFDVLIKLLDECRRVLCVGGVIALETPNPENVLVGSHYFYMDPTHRNPLPPEALRWIVEARGFAMTRVERWTQARPMNVPADLDADAVGATAVNALLGHLRVAPDYAVVGRRL